MKSKKINHNGQKVILSHYPMYAWDCSHYGSYHCHGHEHGSLKDSYDQTGKILDVGVNTNNYYPYSIDQIFEIMDNKPVTGIKWITEGKNESKKSSSLDSGM